ncbi:DEAD/DEAH box helicase [Gloeobacter violaceus]|uniref:Gll2418 protein n=1 Tax=Gloeobacter violaceus (strain ATCC 29082 / PCC 7421) TaxID=251221 RepID=Q7NHW7_GLOVI|nr:DEAD/DEAH box helicase [Gloeobacter violaceus]BAC90359.1 gll2418 [Gloeobacter violaceus PCC 7421]
MHILHGTWIPDQSDCYVAPGAFYLWVETPPHKSRTADAANVHPAHLKKQALQQFLINTLGIAPNPQSGIVACYFLLPTADDRPLPSLESARHQQIELPESSALQYWQVDCLRLPLVPQAVGSPGLIRLLHDLHFQLQEQRSEVQFGSDLLFWHHFCQFLKVQIFKDRYIPALRYRELPRGRGKSKTAPDELYPGWELVCEHYAAAVAQYAEGMPTVCASGRADRPQVAACFAKQDLLHHFGENLLHAAVGAIPVTAALGQQIHNSLVQSCLTPRIQPWSAAVPGALEDYRHWRRWRERLSAARVAAPFVLCLQLLEPEEADEDGDEAVLWQLRFAVASRSDPSWRLSLLEYWQAKAEERESWRNHLGEAFERHLLAALGYAARIYPALWEGLHTSHPVGLDLEVEEAFAFLQDAAWVLEEAGFRVLVPAWWTPEGRRRAQVRLRARAGRSATGPDGAGRGHFSLAALVEYSYALAIGAQEVTESEWQALVALKTPLVRFRGQWLVLEAERMEKLLTFWREHRQERPAMPLLEWLKLTASQPDLDIECDAPLQTLLTRLHDPSRLVPLGDPPGLLGTLRPYQRRGVSWLSYLEQVGLNGCLADDMGLGKSLQVIARLLYEREEQAGEGPTLIVAPTSVIGNWRKEIEKFAPGLRVWMHYGTGRHQQADSLCQVCLEHDVVLTSYTLARKDEKLLAAVPWRRLVIDEAQNIKNPKAAQTRALLKIPAACRLALTGTPVENRLLDLWSIFHFLNPGYLGSEAQFRKRFELPIHKEDDRSRTAVLKRLVEPLILRRVKTDPAIIQDLPDKVEQKLFCQLTREQASLYAAVLKEVEAQIEQVEGIARKGLILATLTRLKQICNHPMQFLQDGSAFSPERSHKLCRLDEMAEEVLAEGESLLVFTQFHEIGAALERHFRQVRRWGTYYIHGGVSREKREKLIADFQDPDSEPAVFILSLKAGGVGITLTRANHVFHFDRWWNPAVEDQATDRAFRIGQTKNVFVHKFVALGTLEERIDRMLEEKKRLASAIVGSDEGWLTELDNERFKALIALGESALIE